MKKCVVYACMVVALAVPPTTTQSNLTNESCTMASGEIGVCVQKFQCNEKNSVNTDGKSIIDIRARDGPCESYLDVCCSVSDKRNPKYPINPSPDVQPVPESCGQWNKDGVGFKTTGDVNGEAKFGEFPWMVAILKVQPAKDKDVKVLMYVGGGSLIHPRVVLTAAHKVHMVKDLKARAGEWDTQTTKEIYPYQDRDVIKVIDHKDFNKDVLFYDIALLIVESAFDMAPNVGVACLPQSNEGAVTDTRCFASGWGQDKFGKEGRYQVILKKVDLPIVRHRACQTALRKTRLGRLFELHRSFVCAGGEPGHDTCADDGGSPLVCPIEVAPNRYVQHGIVAWGIGCGENGTSGVYVDVSVLREWIDDKVVGNGFDPRVYTYI